VSQDHQDTPAAGNQPAPPTATGFDTEFATVSGSPGVRQVWQQATPDLPPEIEPYSFVSIALLGTWPTPSPSRLDRRWSTWAVDAAVLGSGWPDRRAPC